MKQARSYLDFGRLDLAFTEYLTTTFILSNILPTHKDAPEIAGNPRLSAMKKDILQVHKLDLRYPVYANRFIEIFVSAKDF